MTVAFDASTASATFTTTTPFTFSHTALSAPKAAILYLVTSGGNPVTGAVSYGGVAHEASGNAADPAGELGSVYFFYWDSDLPQGTQTISIAHDGSALVKHAVVMTFWGNGPLSVVGAASAGGDQADPKATVNSTEVSLRSAALFSGHDAVASLTPVAGVTTLHSNDFGTNVAAYALQTSAASTSADIGWTATSEDVAFFAAYVEQTSTDVPSKSVRIRRKRLEF